MLVLWHAQRYLYMLFIDGRLAVATAVPRLPSLVGCNPFQDAVVVAWFELPPMTFKEQQRVAAEVGCGCKNCFRGLLVLLDSV